MADNIKLRLKAKQFPEDPEISNPNNSEVGAASVDSTEVAPVELPCVTVVMPIYNEPITTLMTAVNSVIEVEYPLTRMHLVLAFDDDKITDIYLALMHCLIDSSSASKYKKQQESVPSHKEGTYPLMCDIFYRNLLVTSCRFKHGGKRHAQMCAYQYLEAKYNDRASKPLLLFIDSDIQLDTFSISYFVHDFVVKKKTPNHPQRDAMTGLITCKTSDTYNFWKVLQDTEYIESQMLHRNAEDYLGSVSCLPGALTMMRFEALQSVSHIYFNEMEATDSLDFQRCHLGEDRYLTVGI